MEGLIVPVILVVAAYGNEDLSFMAIEYKISIVLLLTSAGVLGLRIIFFSDGFNINNLLDSLAINFVAIAVTVGFVERIFRKDDEQIKIYERVLLYERARVVVQYIDEIFYAVQRYDDVSLFKNLEDIHGCDDIKKLFDQCYEKHENLKNEVEIGRACSLDAYVKRLCEQIITMTGKIQYTDYGKRDNELVLCLKYLAEKSFIVNVVSWWNLLKEEQNKGYIYGHIAGSHDLEITVQHIKKIHEILDCIYKEIHKNKEFTYVQPPFFGDVVS